MTKVIVCGACGRMGSKIAQLVSQNKEMELVGVIERDDHPDIGKNLTYLPLLAVVKNKNIEGLIGAMGPDVIVDFTNPEATLKHLEIAAKYKKAVVIGTTGLKKEHITQVKELAKESPCVMAPNMSQGVNLLFKLVKEVAMTLPGYDAEIVESHHNQKKDAPSGTAYKLAEEIALGYADADPENAKNRVLSHGRQGIIGPRKAEEIGIHSIRAGDIVGEHTVIFAGPGERIELIHRAHSRDVFAYGAIKAAKWIVGKPAGLYDMRDVLGIK